MRRCHNNPHDYEHNRPDKLPDNRLNVGCLYSGRKIVMKRRLMNCVNKSEAHAVGKISVHLSQFGSFDNTKEPPLICERHIESLTERMHY